jgi:hypothetical protein
MATKKQKRAAAQAKREAFLAEVEADGLKALAEDKERQKIERARWVDAVQEINVRHRAILKSAYIMNQVH